MFAEMVLSRLIVLYREIIDDDMLYGYDGVNHKAIVPIVGQPIMVLTLLAVLALYRRML